MFDNLREPENNRQSFQEAIGMGPALTPQPEPLPEPSRRGLPGMSAPQRFVIALLLLVAVVVLGTMCLLITGRISAF
jgi:hypothetical protein